MGEYRMNDVNLQEFLHSFRDGDGKLPSDFDHIHSGDHNLSHLFKGNAVKRELPDFLLVDEKEKLTKMYRFPAKEQTVVADRSIRYQEAAVR